MAKRRFRSRGRFSRVRRRRMRPKRLGKYIKRVVRRMSEVKYVTTALGAPALVDAFTGLRVRLNPNLPQGTDKNERIGNKIRMKYCQFRMSFAVIKDTVDPPPPVYVVRVVLVQARLLPADGLVTGPSFADVFIDATDGSQIVHSSINNNMVRVIMDRTYVMQNLDAVTGDDDRFPPGLQAAKYIKKKWRQNNNVLFRSSTQITPQDPKDNFYLMMISNANGNNEARFFYNYNWRMSFIDL